MILYHSTSVLNKDSILQFGLLKKYSNYWKGSGGCIYLSTYNTPDFGQLILQIDTTGLYITEISEWEYICWEDISANRIKLQNY